MMGRRLVAYGNGDLVDMCVCVCVYMYIYIYIYNKMGNVKYLTFLWFNLRIQILKLDRC